MLVAARDAIAFVVGSSDHRARTRADLDTDAMFRRALINAIQEIGEAAARVTDEGRARGPTIPWGQIVQMRHFVVHVYWGVNLDHLWETVSRDIPKLIVQLESILASWRKDHDDPSR